ncbi:venom toxin OcyC11-like [Physella acuta]|uniref:venom toxin OcyC11-like n=1 Tax=Physella acuta TaxID=109671 RepID=UPI0027DBA9C0|nr:venom toxin OcyC11-like [Physella acuta]
MNKIVLTLVVCLGLVGYVSASTSYGMGACPDGVEVGESWYPSGCQRCDCYGGSYQCYSCGSVSFPPECTAFYDTTKNYPDCCEPRLVCPDDLSED